jgi:hypothetical protein
MPILSMRTAEATMRMRFFRVIRAILSDAGNLYQRATVLLDLGVLRILTVRGVATEVDARLVVG